MNSRANLLTSVLVLALPGLACAFVPEAPLTPRVVVGSQDENLRFDEAPPEREDVKWFHSGWYVGASVGSARADASASDIDSDLAARGYTTNTNLDSKDIGWKMFGGYRFDEPWAIELAIVDLGLIESTIHNTDAPDLDAFLADIAAVHPHSGAGLSLTGIYYPVQTERFNLGVKAGLWIWDADVVADGATGETVDIDDENNIDPVIGLLGLIDLGRNFSARLEWERYFLENNDVDYFAVGIQYALPQ